MDFKPGRCCPNRASEILWGCMRAWMLTNQTPKYPGKHERQILAKGADNISEGLFCESSYTASIAFPPKITVYTVVMWPKPVHKDPEFKIRMKAPICFQIAEKLGKAQSSQMQNHLLFQHLREHFFFLWSIWKTVSSAKNKNNPPVRHPEAWQWSQKQITSFRSAWRYEA